MKTLLFALYVFFLFQLIYASFQRISAPFHASAYFTFFHLFQLISLISAYYSLSLTFTSLSSAPSMRIGFFFFFCELDLSNADFSNADFSNAQKSAYFFKQSRKMRNPFTIENHIYLSQSQIYQKQKEDNIPRKEKKRPSEKGKKEIENTQERSKKDKKEKKKRNQKQ